MKENELYEPIRKYFKTHFNCFKTEIMTGNRLIGNADVVGIRDIGGLETGDIEIITVEVKLSKSNFGKIIGQALGYSLMCNRCYLAVLFDKQDGFLEEHKILANKLGVGLIEIRNMNDDLRCMEVLSSKYFEPDNLQFTKLLWSFKMMKCVFCGNVFASEGEGEAFYKHVKRKPIMFTTSKREEPQKWSGICNECIKRLKKLVKN